MTDHRVPEGKVLVMMLALLASSHALAEPPESGSIGDGIAAFALGEHERARTIFERLASGGDGEANWRLGWMAESGHGGPADIAGAAAYYARAAESGHAAARARLAELAAAGTLPGAGGDPLDLLERSAESGSVRAMILLGKAHAEGEMTAFDPEAAKAWFARALDADPDGNHAAYARNAIAILEKSSPSPN